MSEPIIQEIEQVLVTDKELVIVTVTEPATYVVSVGEVGPQGPPGEANVGGLPVELTDPAIGDVLAIGDGKIINIKQPTLVDGGNF